jgi:hypothetical protein
MTAPPIPSQLTAPRRAHQTPPSVAASAPEGARRGGCTAGSGPSIWGGAAPALAPSSVNVVALLRLAQRLRYFGFVSSLVIGQPSRDLPSHFQTHLSPSSWNVIVPEE